MKVITLVEDSQKDVSLGHEHGLSFYIQTDNHEILFDLGQGNLYSINAKKLGVDLTNIDSLIISHGHYDHGGGLEHFLSVNDQAKIYIMKSAFDELYSMRTPNEYTYIGLSKTLSTDRFILLEDDFKIDEEITLFTNIKTKTLLPKSNSTLYKKQNGEYIKDEFNHEQNLLINSNEKHYLFAGCAHKGIVNIIKQAEEHLKKKNLTMVFSGFHLKSRYEDYQESKEDIEKIALILKDNRIGKYYTGHCTGSKAFKIMKYILKERLLNLYTGFIIDTEV